MAPLLTIDADNAALYAAFDLLGAELDAFIKPAAFVTAQAIQREARARVRVHETQAARACVCVRACFR